MGEGFRGPVAIPAPSPDTDHHLPQAWRDFIRYCRDLRHGQIERLCIQDGLPVLAEVTTKKVKFGQGSR